jgi:hypothetical protein
MDRYGMFRVVEWDIRFEPTAFDSGSHEDCPITAFSTQLSDYMKQKGVESHYVWVKKGGECAFGGCYAFAMMLVDTDCDPYLDLYYAMAEELLGQGDGEVWVDSVSGYCDDDDDQHCQSATGDITGNCSLRSSRSYTSVLKALSCMARTAVTDSVSTRLVDFGCSPLCRHDASLGPCAR